MWLQNIRNVAKLAVVLCNFHLCLAMLQLQVDITKQVICEDQAQKGDKVDALFFCCTFFVVV